MNSQRKVLALAAAIVISVANIAALAQQPLDRTKIPTPESLKLARAAANPPVITRNANGLIDRMAAAARR